MTKVLILGASGMLGDAVTKEFVDAGFDLTLTSRNSSESVLPTGINQIAFDASLDSPEKLNLSNFNYVINCIGVIKPRIHDDNQEEIETAIVVNSLFPSRLATAAKIAGARIIQIATDCVFSGDLGHYSETDHHDAEDVYGKTKSLGETSSGSMMHLRVSTIGPEQARSTLLLEWVRNQPQNAQITGYTDHLWNGITTAAFARIARGVVENNNFVPGVHHIVPADEMTKAELVSEIARAFGRDDIQVTPAASRKPVNRTLKTNDDAFNVRLWMDAKYQVIPTLKQLLAEIAG